MGAASVVPYTIMLGLDPGCPLFVSFVVNVGIVLVYLPRAASIVRTRKIPLTHHLAIVVLGYMFNTLKCDAFTR